MDDPYEKLEAKVYASYQKLAWQQTFKLLDLPDFRTVLFSSVL